MNKLTNLTKLVSKKEIIFIGTLLLLTILAMIILYRPQNDVVAQITYNDKLVKEIILNDSEDEVFILPENEKVSFEIKDKKARFINVQCPDKLCEQVGFIDKTNQIAICMPNRVTLKITGGKSDFDVIV